jgi:hypothetical protein
MDNTRDLGGKIVPFVVEHFPLVIVLNKVKHHSASYYLQQKGSWH